MEGPYLPEEGRGGGCGIVFLRVKYMQW
jgi:hypothetical protein